MLESVRVCKSWPGGGLGALGGVWELALVCWPHSCSRELLLTRASGDYGVASSESGEV